MATYHARRFARASSRSAFHSRAESNSGRSLVPITAPCQPGHIYAANIGPIEFNTAPIIRPVQALSNQRKQWKRLPQSATRPSRGTAKPPTGFLVFSYRLNERIDQAALWHGRNDP